MNSSLVKSAPPGEFAEVSALMKGWQTRFQLLVSQRRPIKCDFYPLPQMPQILWNEVERLGYVEMILEKDRWQLFLVPMTS
ncbi:MAG: hypothetical protein WCS42_03495 [Verrucomicrobiota bacterium]